ncbi:MULTISPECIES: hypothetical protein [Micrococcaceae]|uniref:hypothetical protein n=1 Tax=Micrococcaceae TaxID=1268 RepID=UPI0007020F47|nr:hypothetical protein [Arthrobacter sp. Soil761]KRE65451.1 hypothetical protein ASG79_13850 [Arthrobacter sp. Soil761]
MSATQFTVKDNPSKLYSTEEVTVSFFKDPKVGRIWVMSRSELADLQAAIEAYLATKPGGHDGKPAKVRHAQINTRRR